MILKLRIYRLPRNCLRLLHGSHTRPIPRTIPATRSRPPHDCTNRSARASAGYCRGRPPLLSSSCLRGKNGRSPRTFKPNSLYCLSPRSFLRTMLRNLRSQSQLYTNCCRSSTPETLPKLIYPYARRRLAKKLNRDFSVSLLS